MELVTYVKHDNYIIALNGDLDASSSILVDQAIEKAMTKSYSNILINFRLLNYISAAGLGVFISHIRPMQEQNRMMVLFGMENKIRNVFQLTGLDDMIPIVATEEEACSFCKQRGYSLG